MSAQIRNTWAEEVWAHSKMARVLEDDPLSVTRRNKESHNTMTFTICYFRSEDIYSTFASGNQQLHITSCSPRSFACFANLQIFQPLGDLRSPHPYTHPRFPQHLSGPARLPATPAWPGHYPSPSAQLRSWASSSPQRGHDTASQHSVQQQPHSAGCCHSLPRPGTASLAPPADSPAPGLPT